MNLQKKSLNIIVKLLTMMEKKTALYSGRDCNIEEWMHIFDYIKLGSYQEKYGPLTNKNTNQKLYKKDKFNKYKDITYLFWK